MNRWVNKIAVVTGASSGIGAATAKSLAEKGMVVVGLSRRLDKMETEVRPTLEEKYRENFHALQCDVIDENNVKDTFATIKKTFGGVDVLVNNAGILQTRSLVDPDNTQGIKDVVNTNILGVTWCTREAFHSMKQRNFDGHLIFINSLMGHLVPHVRRFSTNIYSPSKHALTAMVEVYRQECLRYQTKIKVTSISPGTVQTDIMGEGFKPREGLAMLKSEDIADSVVHCLQTPPHVQVSEMIIRPTGTKLIHRWVNKIAVVTGASSGIGAATAKSLAEKGMVVVGLSRRLEKMETEVRPTLEEKYRENFHTLQCDVVDERNVTDTFATIKEKFGGVDVLVNNAGVLRTRSLVDPDNTQDMKDTVNTNILGVTWCTREAFRSMKQRNFDGHIIFINSLTGHIVPYVRRFSFNIYSPSKHALTAMAEAYRLECLRYETKIRITNISPGTVNTDIMGEGFSPREGLGMLKCEDIAESVVHCLQTPPHVQVSEMIIRPTGTRL